MENLLQRKRIIVTGGAGFLGSHLMDQLRDRGCSHLCVADIADYDLRNRTDIKKLFRDFPAEIVIHLAGSVGGIGANQANPGSFFYDNAIMGIELMEQARQTGVQKFVALGSVCSYPKSVFLPGREEDIWNGYPEETNAPYGMAKKILLVQSESYRRQYGFNSICLVAANLYGPGDHFDPDTSHVIPALIRKFSKAVRNGARTVVCWGDGTPTREFLYVQDCAEAILLATQFYNDSKPVNLGSGVEISIADLARLIARLTGFDGRIVWDTSRPKGQDRRVWDVSRAETAFGFRAQTPLEEGLRQTIDWYRQHVL